MATQLASSLAEVQRVAYRRFLLEGPSSDRLRARFGGILQPVLDLLCRASNTIMLLTAVGLAGEGLAVLETLAAGPSYLASLSEPRALVENIVIKWYTRNQELARAHGLPPIDQCLRQDVVPRELRGIVLQAQALIPPLGELVATLRYHESLGPAPACPNTVERTKMLTSHLSVQCSAVSDIALHCLHPISPAMWLCLDPKHAEWSPVNLLRVAQLQPYVHLASGTMYGGLNGPRHLVFAIIRAILTIDLLVPAGVQQRFTLCREGLLQYLHYSVDLLLAQLQDSVALLRSRAADRTAAQASPALAFSAFLSHNATESPISDFCPEVEGDGETYSPLFI